MSKQEERYAAYQSRRKKKKIKELKSRIDLTCYTQDRFSKLLKSGFRMNISR